MLERSPKTHLGSAVIPFLNSWLCMMMMPACAPIDQTVLVHALHRTQGKVQLLNINCLFSCCFCLALGAVICVVTFSKIFFCLLEQPTSR